MTGEEVLHHMIRKVLPDLLVTIENTAEAFGWDAPPMLLGLFHDRTCDDAGPRLVVAEPVPYRPDIWHMPDPDQPGRALHPTVVLNRIADDIADTETRSRTTAWLEPRRRTFAGMAFAFEGWQFRPYADYRHGDINQVPAMADAEVRIVVAIDVDGGYYQVVRFRGDSRNSVTVHDEPPPDLLEADIPQAVTRLVTTIAAL
ncbi:hypothetical protein [Polymorphospora sp. NPDC050346]|uniref:hypothetical protein n=1 Tax=Polymorphospora sp. NPDC050346 TaxID=3155780 RepID=UPI0033FCC3D2